MLNSILLGEEKNTSWCKVMLLICMSTVFLKQHSLLDVIAGTFLAIVMYYICYEIDWKRIFAVKKVDNQTD